MASTRQCLLNQFADFSVCANQNNFHKNSILVSDLRSYLFTFNLGANPPVVAITCPVTQRRARNHSLHRRLLALPGGGCPSIAVSTRPGATAFTATPLGSSSAAQTRVNASWSRVTRSR